MSKKPAKPIEVFYSYSHEDEELRDELEKHLAILKRQGVITGWYDRRIGAGREWAGEIDAHLNTADVILLLISADFLASDYCYDVEMKRAMERHEAGEAHVIPVILRPVVWEDAPFGKFQALPKDTKPVTSWPDSDQAFENVARGIQATVEELLGPSAGPPSPAGTAELEVLRDIGINVSQTFSADSFFHCRSDIPQFELRLEQGEDIWISGITLRALQANYSSHIQSAVYRGTRFRFLFVNPGNTSVLNVLAASNPIFHNDADYAKRVLLETLACFRRFRITPRGDIEIRVLDFVPSSSMIIVDGNKPNGHMTVGMYGYQIPAGQQLHFELTRTKDPQTFAFYLRQFEAMWEGAGFPNV